MRPILAFVLTAVLSIGSTQAMAQSGMRTEGDVATAQGVYEAEVPVNSQAVDSVPIIHAATALIPSPASTTSSIVIDTRDIVVDAIHATLSSRLRVMGSTFR